jgi:amino acid transporter
VLRRPLIFLISMVGMVATASSLAQFASIYPSAGSFITYITRAIGTKVAVAVGVITILGYIIAFGGIYMFVGSYDVAGDLRGRARRAVEPVAGRDQPPVPHAGRRGGRVRGAQHRHRRDIHGIHRPGHRVRLPA